LWPRELLTAQDVVLSRCIVSLAIRLPERQDLRDRHLRVGVLDTLEVSLERYCAAERLPHGALINETANNPLAV